MEMDGLRKIYSFFIFSFNNLCGLLLVLPSISLLIFCFSSCFFVVLLFLNCDIFYCLRLLIQPLLLIVALFFSSLSFDPWPLFALRLVIVIPTIPLVTHFHLTTHPTAPKIPRPQWSQWMPPAPLLTISPIQLSFHLPSLLLAPIPPPSLLPALIPAPLFPALIPHLPPHSLNFPPLLLLPLPLPTPCLTWAQPSMNSPQLPFQMSSFLAFPSTLT